MHEHMADTIASNSHCAIRKLAERFGKGKVLLLQRRSSGTNLEEQVVHVVSRCQLSILLPEVKHAIKRQLYSKPL